MPKPIYRGNIYSIIMGKGKLGEKLRLLTFRSLENELHQAETQTPEKGFDSPWLVLVFLSLEEGTCVLGP